MCVALITLAER